MIWNCNANKRNAGYAQLYTINTRISLDCILVLMEIVIHGLRLHQKLSQKKRFHTGETAPPPIAFDSLTRTSHPCEIGIRCWLKDSTSNTHKAVFFNDEVRRKVCPPLRQSPAVVTSVSPKPTFSAELTTNINTTPAQENDSSLPSESPEITSTVTAALSASSSRVTPPLGRLFLRPELFVFLSVYLLFSVWASFVLWTLTVEISLWIWAWRCVLSMLFSEIYQVFF